MKTYTIYYLPNAIRDYGNGKILYGKIGCTADYTQRVLRDKSTTPRFGPLDITGHHVLEIIEGTKEEAAAIERIWQDNFLLVDGGRSIKYWYLHSEETKQKMRKPKSEEHIEKIRLGNLGKKLTPEHIESISVPQTIVTCPNCGHEGGARAMKRWHFDNCKHKK